MTHNDIYRLFSYLAEHQRLNPRTAALVLQNVMQILADTPASQPADSPRNKAEDSHEML